MEEKKNLGTPLAFGALVLAIAGALSWFATNASVGIPENRSPFVALWLSAAALGVYAIVKSKGWLGRLVSVPAIVIGLFLTFTVAISPQAVASGAIQVGDMLPAFTAVDDAGETFDSETLRGHPVLIKFFRAHW